MRLKLPLANLGLLLVSMVLAAGMAEIALRLGGWRISPVRFVLASEPGDDWRLHHAGGSASSCAG